MSTKVFINLEVQVDTGDWYDSCTFDSIRESAIRKAKQKLACLKDQGITVVGSLSVKAISCEANLPAGDDDE